MVGFKTLYNRRKDLLEQIGNAADEIMQIDIRLASLRPLSVKEIPSGRKKNAIATEI